MTLPTWPTQLPAPTPDSYGYALPELNQRTPFALGGRVRPLFADGPDDFSSISVILDGPQCRRMKAWLRYEAANGASWFSMPLRVDDAFLAVEARFVAPPAYSLISFKEWRVTLPLETRTGTTISREEYEDLIGVIGFEDFIQTLITPSDTAIINPADGDAAPGAPIPWLGLYLPFGARIALEGDDGRVEPIELPPNIRFTGLIPRRLLQVGTDADAVVYGLSHPTVTALPANSGNRIVPVVPSDTVSLPSAAVGGIYTGTGGQFAYLSTTGAGSVLLPPKRWQPSPAITRVTVAGTDAGFAAVAFVQS